MQSLPLVAATWDARETVTNPFVWPPPSVPLPAQVPGKFPAREAFPGFAIAPAFSPLLPHAPTDLPWLPGDLDPIALPDGMPVRGNPAGLALLENAVGNGIVVGEVSDATSLDPIPGALIELVGTGRTAEADAQGRFEFAGLPAGTFNIEASQLGYFTDTTVVTVVEGSPSEIRFGLRARPTDDTVDETTLEEETIVGEYQEESQGNFNLDIAITPTISSGLSSEDFKKGAVSDAGEAVEKISGANVVDGKFAVVRGLADRYISTSFNGATISSAVPSRKAVQLDLFPTSALSGINVDKIYSPQLSGDFGGAAIDIRTKTFPDNPVVDFKFKQEYNPYLPDQMLLNADTDLEYFSDLGETLDVGEITQSDGFLIGGPEFPDGNNQLQADAAKNAWSILHSNRTLIPESKDTEQKQSFGVTLGDTFALTEALEFGILATGGAGGEDNFNESPILEQNGNTRFQQDYQRQREWNLYVAGGFKLGENHEVSATYFRKNITQHNVAKATDIIGGSYGNIDSLEKVRQFYNADAAVSGNFYEIDPIEQDLEVIQLSGKHKLGERGPSFAWALTESDALEDRPNYSIFRTTTLDFNATDIFQQVIDQENELFYSQIQGIYPSAPEFNSLTEAGDFLVTQGFPSELVDALTQGVVDQYPVTNPSLGQIETLALSDFTGESGNGNTSSRTTQSVKENTSDQNINLDFPFYFDEDHEDNGMNFGLGLSNVNRTRMSRGAIYDLVPEFLDAAGQHTVGLPGNVIVGNGEAFAADPALLLDFFTGYLSGSPYYEDDTTGGILNLINNVDGFHDIQSHYFSSEFFWGETFVRGGLRYESETRTAEILPPRPKLPPELLFPPPINESVVLPSISFGTSFYDGKLSFLSAWSETVARPTFHEWLPTRSVDLSTGILRIGNASLENASVENIDFSTGLKISDSSDLRVSVFRKTITDPIIEERRDPSTIGYSNGDQGNIQGVELEYEFKDTGPFTFATNLTYIEAELIYTVLSQTGQIVTTTERFPFQPNWIYNISTGYENEDLDFGANLIYNFVGEYSTILRRVSTDANLLQSSQHSLDLVLRKGFRRNEEGEGWLFTCGIKNLIATDKEFTWQGGGPVVDGNLQSRSAAQRTYFLEAKYEF